ncbi:MAG: dehydrogenase [Negativicutes bacterium]|nr:dehydrogenase [Negativicutes bacterium]
MKIIIIGGVAGGTTAAAKARRNDKTAEIKIFEADQDISYAGCALPYYISDKIADRTEVVPRNPAFFKQKYNIDIFTGHRVLEIKPEVKMLTIENLATQEVFEETYDKLLLATGAVSTVLPIEGSDKDNVFYLRTVANADKIRKFILEENPKSAVIVGTGFIGMELAESFSTMGIKVTMVELAPHVMPTLDSEMSEELEKYLHEQKVTIVTGDSAVRFDGSTLVNKVVLKSGRELTTDFVVMAVGIKPNVSLAQKAGVKLGPTGAIQVNAKMETSVEDIYACGDCAESFSIITGKPFYRPLGSTANKMGRVAGDQITGGDLEFQGGLGTGIFKVFDMAVAQTGLTEKEALREGYEVTVSHDLKPDKPEYYDGQDMLIKAVADKKTGRVLGAQIIGTAGIDKRIDIFVTAITFGAKAEDLANLDLAYSPPFSTAKDPVIFTGMILGKG